MCVSGREIAGKVLGLEGRAIAYWSGFRNHCGGNGLCCCFSGVVLRDVVCKVKIGGEVRWTLPIYSLVPF